ncbi:hypothetical protein ACRARG_05295 [Pseudooceanicola sp. C21-150M6]|uniref:hypothetical protein n=1 Tax=Pseudooceanicola sp. C21-150M6 TaxID=3434355 RepID=UPI003D7FCF9F
MSDVSAKHSYRVASGAALIIALVAGGAGAVTAAVLWLGGATFWAGLLVWLGLPNLLFGLWLARLLLARHVPGCPAAERRARRITWKEGRSHG